MSGKEWPPSLKCCAMVGRVLIVSYAFLQKNATHTVNKRG